jgi:uncharacterized protein
MQQWASRLSELGRVQLFDYSYFVEGRRRPDPLPQLIATHRRALAAARSEAEEVILIGKSMGGGRIGCHVALEENVAGVICLGYPLCASGDPSKLRDKVLRRLATPILFVQGTRDSLCPLDLLEQVRAQMVAPNDLYIVEQGDHSLRVPKRFHRTQEEVDSAILAAIKNFCVG